MHRKMDKVVTILGGLATLTDITRIQTMKQHGIDQVDHEFSLKQYIDKIKYSMIENKVDFSHFKSRYRLEQLVRH